MSLLDTVYTYKFVRALVTPWTDTDAYKLGIVDEKGKILKKATTLKTDEEKKAYTPFHRLAWNIKRLVQKMPGGSTRFANYASALFLIKENGDAQDFSDFDLELFEQAIEDHMDMLTEEPTNVIGNAGENDNIATYDPKLIKKVLRRKKKLPGKSLEQRKKETPAISNEEMGGETGYGTFQQNQKKDKERDAERKKRLKSTKPKKEPFTTSEGNDMNEEKLAGWIALFGGKKIEIKKGIDAKDLYSAKQFAIKHFKPPKSKQGLLAIKPAYESFESDSNFDVIREAMKRRKKRDAHGRVKKFYKRIGDCPPGKVKNREGG